MRPRRIGVLMAGDRSYPSYTAFMDALQLATSGTAAETTARFAEGRHERLQSLADEIASTDPDVIVAIGAVSHFAVHAAVGSSVPIVFAVVVDPFAAGILAGPGSPTGNVTGATSFDPGQALEQIELLRSTIGHVTTLAIIGDADVPPLLADLAEQAARAERILPISRLIRSPEEIAAVVGDFLDAGATCLLGLEVPRINTHCLRIAEAATAAGLPTIFARDMARAAPLLAHGTSLSEAARRAAVLAARVLEGEDPATLPVEVVAGKELIVNLATARRLSIQVPQAVLHRAASIIGRL